MRTVLHPPRRWSDDDIAWLATLYPAEPLALVAFALGRRNKVVSTAARNHGIAKVALEKHPFTPMEDAWIVALFPRTSTKDVAAALGRATMSVQASATKLGIHKDADYVTDTARHCGAELARKNLGRRFEKGHASHNKGRKGWCPPGSERTWFKKGHQRSDTAAIGAERIDPKDGYILIKVSKAEQGAKALPWQPKHRVLWERAHGKVPKGMVLKSIDGNKQNTAPANWRLITLAENMKRNTIHNYPKPIAEAVQLRGAINRRINAIARKQHDARRAEQ